MSQYRPEVAIWQPIGTSRVAAASEAGAVSSAVVGMVGIGASHTTGSMAQKCWETVPRAQGRQGRAADTGTLEEASYTGIRSAALLTQVGAACDAGGFWPDFCRFFGVREPRGVSSYSLTGGKRAQYCAAFLPRRQTAVPADKFKI